MDLYKWEKREDGIRILAYEGAETTVTVPDYIEGMPVTELGPYSFRNQRQLEAVSLPDHLGQLGAHCFYDCRNLKKVRLADGIRETGDGCFKNCRQMEQIEMHCIRKKMTVLRSILEECSQKITVMIWGKEGETRLIFPAYLQDYQENTQARIINQVTYGAGVHYRQCIREQGMDYRSYDSCFSLLSVIEQESVAGEAAVLRLQFPWELEEEYRRQYTVFLERNFDLLAETWIGDEKWELLEGLLSCEILGTEGISRLLMTAHRLSALPAVSFLLQYKKEHERKEEADEFAL